MAVTAPAAQRTADPSRVSTRHLVLVHQPSWQDVNDLIRIAEKVRWLDPTIGVYVLSAEGTDEAGLVLAAKLPTLVVSFGPLGKLAPRRGKIYQGRRIHKFEQLKRLDAAGVPVPRTAILGPDTDLDPSVWGELVVLKPVDIGSSSRGVGIQLIRTTRVRYIAPDDYPEDHPGRKGPMLIQQYVDTGPQVTAYRVLTLFDQPLSSQRVRVRPERVALSSDDQSLETARIATQSYANSDKIKDFVIDADVIAVAKAAARAIPDIPLKGCDVLRDARTGRVYVLELNPGGNTWHFSSGFLAQVRAEEPPEYQQQRLAQFDAFSSAAHVLVDRVRTEAE